MALIVEDGTGLANADAYVSLAEFKAYAAAVGYDLTEYTDEQIERAIRRATIWIDARYGATFLGTWVIATQRLEWPRADVYYRGVYLASNAIPQKLKSAVCEVTWQELSKPGSLNPVADPAPVKSRKVGDVEVQFAVSLSAIGSPPSFSIVDDLLSGIVKGRASAYVGRAVRA